MTDNAIVSFTDLVDLASERLGGAAILCSDDFFAGMDSLVKAKDAVWIEDAYGDRGKWMDGWESKRSHRENHEGGHEDFCVIRLGAPGVIRGIVIDTAFFRGNFPSHAALEGTSVDGYPSEKDVATKSEWVPLVRKSALEGNAKNAFAITNELRFTHVRLRIFPDGGVARLRVFGEPLPDWRVHGGLDSDVELSSAELGGIVISCSDMFFGSRHNLLFPGHSGGMHDGWETKRVRRPGFDWALIKLAVRGAPSRIVVDTSHFKGNCPESFALEGSTDGETFFEVYARTELRPHTRHVFECASMPVTHVRLRVFPDGGVSRFRLFGRVDEDERERQCVRRIDAMLPAELQLYLRSCCGSSSWVRAMAAEAPFGTAAALHGAASQAFGSLSTDDWLEAFRAHPRIGGTARPQEGAAATATSKAWSSGEQRGVLGAKNDVVQKLAAKNEEYFAKHGFIFIVMATGKTAPDILALLEERLRKDRDTEILTAAAEQARITAHRLRKIA
jgi:allantoicase